MTATMTDLPERVTPSAAPAAEYERTTRRPAWAVLAMVGGLLVVAASTAPLVMNLARETTHAAGAASTSAVSLPTVGTSATTYLPGHSSAWHVHPGVHSVVVLRGTLTIYDEHCVRSEYGPGQVYLGGDAPHLARNDGAESLDVAITFVYLPLSGDHGVAVSPPEGCDLR